MRLATVLTLVLANIAWAAPLEANADVPRLVELEARVHFEATGEFDLSRRRTDGTTANELIDGECQDVTFIWARGSTEEGNIGAGVGLSLVTSLRDQLSSVGIQGVTYAALLSTNLIGGDPKGIAEMKRLWELAASKCPNTIIIGGGYSQGAALTHRSIPNVSSAIRNQIAGVVTFGDTYRQQSNGTIEGLSQEKLLIICNDGDLVCEGTLLVAVPHLDYVRRAPEAAAFLVQRVAAVSAS